MWVKVEGKRRSEGQKFVVRCASEAAGQIQIIANTSKNLGHLSSFDEIEASIKKLAMSAAGGGFGDPHPVPGVTISETDQARRGQNRRGGRARSGPRGRLPAPLRAAGQRRPGLEGRRRMSAGPDLPRGG